ncbi:MAG: serine/threonine-protein kinase PknK, partial [Deltaproteobacteria bacterium]|nr:serine/threonine-protein kinase PknK [Deltaproteobacteria bacterium]
MKRRCQSCERTYGPGTQSCPVCGRTLVLAEGSVVGRYRIVRPIAAGGMSQVYLARQKGPIERDVALKVVSIPANADDRAAVDALRNEAFLAGRVSNPHIVTVFDHGEIDGGDLYLAMEYLRGHTLAETLARSGGMDYVRALRIGAQVGEALVAIHEAGLVHRDLKPANIFLVQTEGSQDFVKLLDFGICVPARPTLRSAFSGGRTAGTPLYMSPEQVRGRGVDARSDLYALGAITYELLVGEPPFTGPDVWEAHLSAVPVPISIAKRNVRIPRGLDDLLLRLLSKTPEQRPRSAREVVDRFRQILPSRSGNGRGAEGVRESAPVEDRGWFEAGPRTLLLRDPTYVERRKEHQILRDALDKASSGWGGIVWLVGEEGSGKTTLGTKFLESAEEAGFRTASATAATHASMMGAWRAAVGQLFGVSDRTQDQVREAVVLLSAAAAEGRTPNPLVEGVMDLLYPGPAAFGLLRSDREAFSDYLAASVEHVLRLLAHQSRIALHIDDFHLAGSPSCAFLDRFRRAMEVAPAPILLLLTSRPPTRDE